MTRSVRLSHFLAAAAGAALLTAGLVLVPIGQSHAGQDRSAANPQPLGVGAVRTVASGLKLPWGVAFLPDQSALVAERDTFNIIRVTSSGAKTTIGKVSGVSGTGGEGGLLGLALSPTFSADRWLYVYHSSSSDNRIVRIKYGTDNKLGTKQTLVTGIPRSRFHNGGRIAFGPDGNLYAGTGDAQNTSHAQNRNSLAGKILRMTPDGEAAPGNPFGNRVYSLGHRNVQGLAWDSQRRLWASEFGASSKDELNLIRSGGNYGWPACEGRCSDSRYINPVREWNVADASPSGVAIVNNVIYMACLRGERMYEMRISGSGTATPVAHFRGTYGRLRTIVPSPGGGVWVTTSNGSDRILHVTLT
jgi:glucose/arabinose dehydrogenase